MDSLPSDYFYKLFQFTPRQHHDVYPAIDPLNPELSLADKVILVTGASRGIGATGIVPSLAMAGAAGIVLVATNVEKLGAVELVVRGISPSTRVLIAAADISNEDSVARVFKNATEVFGRVDVLVHNAGVMNKMGNIHEEDAKIWWKQYVCHCSSTTMLTHTLLIRWIQEINTLGTFLVSRYFINSLPSLDSPAVIIYVSTGAAWVSNALSAGYSGSKLAAQKLISDISAGYPNIVTISISPGLVETDMLQIKNFDIDTPELVGGTVVWLTGERARFLNGRAISTNWNVEDLVARKEEIQREDLLTIKMAGKFGHEQFT
ncbi:short-chain dehydrogenase/reductase [Colletotrichum tofieldiae]|uniref:Short-chain dehydrogenase/reductase n=1 Tax=Colletotrichum tofieldiae TaxID=708197 RepID=A0A166R4I8_9PEZI|nr:short-chain dehydrogenase/reductase [Colletotrichum tofieldiae]